MADYTPIDLTADDIDRFLRDQIGQSAKTVVQAQTSYASGLAAHQALVAASQATTAPPEGLTPADQAKQFAAQVQQSAMSVLALWLNARKATVSHAALVAERDRLAALAKSPS